LSYLRELPIDELKIDRAFVSRLGESDSDEMMIKTIFSLADIFNLHVVAEGVETGEQFRLLMDHDCHIFQGYYFAKPMREEDFEIHLFRDKIKKVNTELSIKKEMNRKMVI
jgi:EAL domain-containing protein (putative c-di-GMP-specific phosphodiesterase class I)